MIPPLGFSSPDDIILIEEDEVRSAILSFPNDSAGDPNGLHLSDLIGFAAEGEGINLLHAVTDFINYILCPPSVRPIFYGATLISLKKKDGSLRPIAVGFTLRRLIAKCLSRRLVVSLGSYFSPLQLGFGTPRGAEAAAHAGRLFLNQSPPDHLLLKLDFKNAFNSLTL